MSWREPLTLEEVEHHWRWTQREWVDRLGAQHVIAHDAGHLVHMEVPDLAAHIIGAVVEAVRCGSAVRLDEKQVDRAGARLCPEH